jgi:hypothetical protein
LWQFFQVVFQTFPLSVMVFELSKFHCSKTDAGENFCLLAAVVSCYTWCSPLLC